jgi:hypothetical protein
LNNFAWAYGSTAALPFLTILLIILMWGAITFPLTIVGGITGRLRTNDVIATDKLPKAIKPLMDVPWYKGGVMSFLIAGGIPFR